ncbi:MAG: triose-phosphate isomerase [Flavobacteriales bacterium]
MRRKIVAGNWKMNKTITEGLSLIEAIKTGAPKVQKAGVDIIVAPTYVMLSDAAKAVNGSSIKLAAQNCHQEESGAYTGEISATMIQAIGAEYIIIGHSERRQYFNETSASIAKKINVVLSKGLTPIYCNGEVKEERESGRHFEVVKRQMNDELFHLSAEEVVKVVIAYEPVWAIGTGLTASPDQAQEIHAFIRQLLTDKYGAAVAEEISILYGGSCKPDNAKEIFSKKDVDGGLIGGAALKAEDFLGIVAAF